MEKQSTEQFPAQVTAFGVALTEADDSIVLQFDWLPHGLFGAENQVASPFLLMHRALAEELLQRLQAHLAALSELPSPSSPERLQ